MFVIVALDVGGRVHVVVVAVSVVATVVALLFIIVMFPLVEIISACCVKKCAGQDGDGRAVANKKTRNGL